MDCQCDYEPSDVWCLTEPKARKEHKCCECGGTIRRGERHKRVSSLYDGRWSTFRRCADCAVTACDLKQLLEGYGSCLCDFWGDMRGEMYNIADYASVELLRKLEPVYAGFNAAVKERGGHGLSCMGEMFERLREEEAGG